MLSDFRGVCRSSDLLPTASLKISFSSTPPPPSLPTHHHSLIAPIASLIFPLSLYHLHLHITFDEIWGPKMISKRGPQRPLLTIVRQEALRTVWAGSVWRGVAWRGVAGLCLFPPPLGGDGEFSRAKRLKVGEIDVGQAAALSAGQPSWKPKCQYASAALSHLATQPLLHYHPRRQQPIQLKADDEASL